ncbi:alcohol dehydrogenase catalytic domain-containing protein [Pseudoclavibacter sp. Z016]|uniref:alcohol dehydrogenase catalytic domain-containing protein n=1 Tax=Pseudoclavibacter sp. Z016 TaxID=2080581 RepID=UPI000CE8BB28|nr:zinc-binding dehydrogenase [Pseudoclavibacter sp. Z016]PPF78103.1 NADPH:quinone reductase [Pseudoclavibacter sp. Z016]
MSERMRAVVLREFGGPEKLQLETIKRPKAHPGEVLIRVQAFGLNRSEYHFRSGVAEAGELPRVPGIEATGIVVDAPGSDFRPGQQVATMMGGMGRSFDGGYAEYVTVPAAQVIPFRSNLDWSMLGALPEMLQTAWGSLSTGLQAKEGDSILIRGGTSSVGLAIAALAIMRGIRVFSTTRNPDRFHHLRDLGIEHPLLENGAVAAQICEIAPDGVDGAVELVGATTLRDTLRAVRTGGTACFTGMLADDWIIPEFYPIAWLPNGVRLTAYSGEANDLPPHVLQDFIDAVERGDARVPIGHVYRMDEIAQAHTDMESGRYVGKLVAVPWTGSEL